MIDSNMLVTIVSIIVTIISIIIVIVTSYDRKRFKDGLKSAYKAKELELNYQKIAKNVELQTKKIELETKKLEAREMWKKYDIGLKLLDLIFSNDEEMVEEYEEEAKE